MAWGRLDKRDSGAGIVEVILPAVGGYFDQLRESSLPWPIMVRQVLIAAEALVDLDLSDTSPAGIRRIQDECEDIVQGYLVPIFLGPDEP